MTHSIYLYIAIMAGVSFLIRTLPLTLIRHDAPRGKGEALRAGFRRALDLGFDSGFRGVGLLIAQCERPLAETLIEPGEIGDL